MRAIKRKWCLDYFKLSILYASLYIFHFSSAVTNADLGLPRTNHCAFSYNQSLYIFGGGTTINNNTNEIIITFDPINWNTKSPTINNSLSSSSNNIDFNNSDSKVKCGLTNSGKAIIVDEKVQVLDIATQTRLNLTYQGSQKAIDAFITNTAPIKDPAVVTFDDYLMIYGGEQSGTTLQSTFILDTRINNLGIWYELSTNSSNTTESSSFIGNPPPPSVNTTLIATSRWILHFRSVKINPVNYTMYIDLFDPFNFNWLGTPIAAFNISTDTVNPVSLDGSDTIMIIPTWTQQQEETTNNNINNNNNNTNTNNNNNIAVTMMDVNSNNNNDVTGFWILNVSSWSPTAKVYWQENPQNNNYHPVTGNSVTAIKNTDLIVFYGGNDDNQEFLLFNTTSRSFENSSSLSWYEAENQNNHQHRNSLAILLGSILGGLCFFILLFILIWCCYIRKRRLRKQEFQSRSYEENHAKERMIPNEGMGADRLCERSNSVASRYLLSPIKSVLPLDIFRDEGNNAEQDGNEKPKVQPDEAIVKKQPTSRFREHFDMTSFANLKKSNDVDQGPSSSQSR